MEQEISFKNSIGLNLKGIISAPDIQGKLPMVVNCHGLNGSTKSAINLMLSEELKKIGIASFRFDFIGHGKSDGRTEDLMFSQCLEDLEAAVSFVRELPWVDASRLALFGRSMGGSVVLRYLNSHSEIKLFSLNAPAVDWKEIFQYMHGDSEIAKWKEKGYISYMFRRIEYKLSYKFYEDGISQNLYTAAKDIKAKALIVHGDSDTTVPVSQSVKLAGELQNAKLEIAAGADHAFLPNMREKAAKLAADFFKENLLKEEVHE